MHMILYRVGSVKGFGASWGSTTIVHHMLISLSYENRGQSWQLHHRINNSAEWHEAGLYPGPHSIKHTLVH